MRIGVGLSIPELATRGGRFSPASLFTAGTVGAWYDPSDYSTLFQDSAGTTPVTAVEQPVGLMLDKSQGLVLGSELATGTPTAYSANGTVSVVGGVVTCTCTTNGNYGLSFGTITSSGKRYAISFTVLTNTGTRIIYAWAGNAGDSMTAGSTTGAKFGYVANNAGGITAIAILGGVAGESFSVSNISVKELPGNHASQATAASRPVLRARYNLLTYSEQFDNAAWTKAQTTISANAVTAPDGTTTADKMVETAVTNVHGAYQTFTYVSGATYSASVYAKQAERSWIYLGADTAAAEAVFFDLANGTVGAQGTGYVGSIQSVGDGWYRCTVTITQSTALPPNYFVIGVTTANNTTSYLGDITKGVYIWGADLRTGSSAGTYQRIAAATDYATAGFLPYLYFVTDDSFGTNSINFSATDKMSVCAGVTKLSDAADGMLVELSATTATNAGSFYVTAPESIFRYAVLSRGSAPSTANQRADTSSTTYNAPSTVVLSGAMNISGDSNNLRLNGTSIATATGDQGTGNYGNYPLFIGRRNNATVPFNGNLYQLIICGKTLSASELASTEAYVAIKTGVTL